MNEGKKLLIEIIDSKLKDLANIDILDYVYDDVNLVELSSSIKDNYDNFNLLTDNIIKEIITNTPYQSLYKDIVSVRDLYIGKVNYNIDIKEDFHEIIELFIKLLDSKLEIENKDITKMDEIIDKCNELKNQINNHEIIEDTEFIKSLVKDYNESQTTKNMLSIMLFITKHNIKLFNNDIMPYKDTIDITELKENRLDERIMNILDKLNVKTKDIPNYLLSDLKICDIDNFVNNYELIRKNKVEKYGILHLIDKDNIVGRLTILMYSNPIAIKNVVDSINLESKSVNIEVIKSIVNSALPVFFVSDTKTFKSHYNDYLNIIEMLKDLGVNYKELIKRCPLFILSNYNNINEVLNELEHLSFNKKTIINRCYKVLATNPYLLIDNANILKTYNIDLNDYSNNDNYKYILLKSNGLYNKLDYIIRNNSLEYRNVDYNEVSKLMINRIVNNSSKEKLWSE